MSGKNRNLSLTAYDELFQTAERRQESSQERIQMLPLEVLHPFPNHPFQVRDDAEMEETTRSIAARGVLVPILVRPRPERGYEIVSGHRRLHASGLAGLKEIPAIVRDMLNGNSALAVVPVAAPQVLRYLAAAVAGPRCNITLTFRTPTPPPTPSQCPCGLWNPATAVCC